VFSDIIYLEFSCQPKAYTKNGLVIFLILLITIIIIIIIIIIINLWLSPASELYRPSDRHLSAKLVPISADKGV
jgi:hypothetical protein